MSPVSRATFVAVTLVLSVAASAADDARRPTTNPAGPLTGTYTWTVEGRDGQLRDVTLTLRQDGDKLTGTVSGWRGDNDIEAGTVGPDGAISFKVTRTWNENTVVTTYTATVTGDTIKGQSSTDRNGEVMTREFEGTRTAAADGEPRQ